jgi:hypothetical protein
MDFKTSITLKRADQRIQAAAQMLKTVQTDEERRQVYTKLTAFAKLGLNSLNTEESPYREMARAQLE